MPYTYVSTQTATRKWLELRLRNTWSPVSQRPNNALIVIYNIWYQIIITAFKHSNLELQTKRLRSHRSNKSTETTQIWCVRKDTVWSQLEVTHWCMKSTRISNVINVRKEVFSNMRCTIIASGADMISVGYVVSRKLVKCKSLCTLAHMSARWQRLNLTDLKYGGVIQGWMETLVYLVRQASSRFKASKAINVLSAIGIYV